MHACMTVTIYSLLAAVPVILDFSPGGGSSRIMEGDMLNLSCMALGWPPPEITVSSTSK